MSDRAKYYDLVTEKTIVVTTGIDGQEWGLVWMKSSNSLKRVKSKYAPMTKDRSVAEGNAEAYARRKGWVRLEQ